MATTKSNKASSKSAEAPAPSGAPVPVVVEGRTLESGGPTPEGKARAEFMDRFEDIRAFNETATNIATRIADSDLGYYDDNVANRRYIAKISQDEFTSAIGTPVVQLRRISWPADEALAGTHVLREDGTFYSIPQGTRSLGDVVDPDSGEPLVGKIDKARHKNRLEAAGLSDVVTLKADGTVEAKK